MTTLLSGLIAGTLLLGSSVAIQLGKRRQRLARLKGLELRPNCLLTRYPIVFISGERSLFRLFDHWNDVPAYLREHGYEVLVLEPAPGRARVASIASAVESLTEKCHLIADSSSERDLENIARLRPANVVSLTVVRNESARRSSGERWAPRAADLRPLDRAIEVFDVSPAAREITKKGWFGATTLFLLHAHNFVSLSRRRAAVDALETAEPRDTRTWVIESRFLDLAISLAERDAQWCD